MALFGWNGGWQRGWLMSPPGDGGHRRGPAVALCCCWCLVSSPQQHQDQYQCQRRWLPSIARGWLQGGAETRTRPAPAGGTHGGVAALALLSKRLLSTNARTALWINITIRECNRLLQHPIELVERQLGNAHCSKYEYRYLVCCLLSAEPDTGTSCSIVDPDGPQPTKCPTALYW